MERTPRRYWNWAITAGAVLVITAAAASGLFQVMVQAVPGYRGEVERYVREITGRPVRIEALGLTWRYYYPSLELIGVALLADDGDKVLLQAERLRLGFGLTRLLRGDYMPNRLELQGLAIDARIDADGRVRVKGMESAGAPGEPLEALRPLTRFARLRVERCRLNLRDDRRGGETYSFGISHAELDRGLLNDSVEAEIALPVSIGDTAHFDGSLSGELLEPRSWSGEGTLALTGLNAAKWVAPYLVRGATLELAGVEARLHGQLKSGTLTHLDAWLQTGAAHARRGRHEASFESLEARVAVEFEKNGWTAQLRQLSLATALGRWPANQGDLRATSEAGAATAYEAHLGYVNVADVAPWLPLVRAPALAALAAGRGVVRDAQLRFQSGHDTAGYSYRARFEDLALPAGERAAGFAGLNGELAGDESGGRAVVQEGPLAVELPGMLLTPTVPLDAFEGEVEWRRRERGWQVGLPQFRWELWTTRGSGRLSLLLPEGRDASPEIDLTAQFQASDVTRAKPLMPLAWSAGLRSWLDASILSGRAAKGELVIRGPLADFPFDDKPGGLFSIDIEARDVLLAYQPDWPVIEAIDAKLEFRGNSLAIEATRGVVSGNPIKSATAVFPDFSTGQLLVDGAVSGEISRYYDFLENSPLRDKFKGLLKQTTASGPATVEIHLDIPVTRARETKASGRVTLTGVELRAAALPEPIRDVRGQVSFGPGGIAAEKLTGQLYELTLDASLKPQTPDVTLLSAGFRLALDPLGKGASTLIPAWIRKRLVGASAWRVELPIGGDQAAPVKLTSDLTGVEVKFPPPLGKPAGESLPVTLTIGSQPAAPLRITVEYQDRFGADLVFAKGATAPLERGTLRIGPGAQPPAQERGLVLSGRLVELDAQAWAAELGGAGIGRQIESVRRADVQVGRAVWGPYAIRDTRYQWSAQKNGWRLTTAGSGAAGEAQWTRADHGVLTARMEHVRVEYAAPADDDEADGAALDPNTLPLYDMDIGRLAVNELDLGRFMLVTARTELGQKVNALKADGGALTLSGDGDWRRRAGQSSATLNVDGTTSDIARLLTAFGYTPNLDAKVARARTALSWAPSDRGIEWQQAQGTVHLEFENGQLRALEPGAGRVLGLVNFYALPRRLTLNFRDVLGSGLGFDRIQGDFELREGNARTQNLRINGPSLRMELSGRIGLAARDYDQQVTVYPDVSAGVTLGAVLLGGPVAGALALIAQEILNKPLDQVTQLSYRVTGSWDNPQVERARAPPPPAPPPRR